MVLRAKRHPKGSKEGGQFAKKPLSPDLPVLVAETQAAQRRWNSLRKKASITRKKYGIPKPGPFPNAPFEQDNMLFYARLNELNLPNRQDIVVTETRLALAKTAFQAKQAEAKNSGYQVNALGKWTNETQWREAQGKKKLDLAKEAHQVGQQAKTLYETKHKPILEDLEETRNLAILEGKTVGDKYDNYSRKTILERDNSIVKSTLNSLWADKVKAAEKITEADRNYSNGVKRARADINENVFGKTNKSRIAIQSVWKDSPGSKRVEEVAVGVEAFWNLIDTNGLGKAGGRVNFREQGGRANSKGDAITLASSDGNNVIVHEMGHWAADQNPALSRKAASYWWKRVEKNPTWGQLRKETGIASYTDSEYAIKDDFNDWYTGKVYVKGNQTQLKDPIYRKNLVSQLRAGESPDKLIKATELVSMGAERLYKDPWKFYEDDPDYFAWTYSTLRGG
jgi:hypothetical protein